MIRKVGYNKFQLVFTHYLISKNLTYIDNCSSCTPSSATYNTCSGFLGWKNFLQYFYNFTTLLKIDEPVPACRTKRFTRNDSPMTYNSTTALTKFTPESPFEQSNKDRSLLRQATTAQHTGQIFCS